jgi:hypothetical protein
VVPNSIAASYASNFPAAHIICSREGVLSGHLYFPAKKSTGKAFVPKPGSYTFVRVLHEDFLRMGTRAFPFGEASGHALLSPHGADSSKVVAAGEVEVGPGAAVLRWTNLSGTYQPASNTAGQAGLPFASFNVFVAKANAHKFEAADLVPFAGNFLMHPLSKATVSEERYDEVKQLLRAHESLVRELKAATDDPDTPASRRKELLASVRTSRHTLSRTKVLETFQQGRKERREMLQSYRFSEKWVHAVEFSA